MFNNLIESSSHRGELKRRGSFFLFTVATYALLFAIAGVASIYAYDAKLAEQDLAVIATVMPMELTPPPVRVNGDTGPHRSPTERTNSPIDVRPHPTAPVDLPTLTPDRISALPNPELPVRGPYKIGPKDLNASLPASNSHDGNAVRSSQEQLIEISTPPPAPSPKPEPRILRSGGVLNGEAKFLPAPAYPQMARMMHLQGKVTVQVLIDETGRVISARAIDGHPLFRQVSESAAHQALFSATTLGGQPVKVSGVITYNFVLQ